MLGILPLLLFFLFFIPFFLFMLFFNVAAFSLARLGLSQEGAVLFFALMIVGSVINIPISRKQIMVESPNRHRFPFLFYYPPQVRQQVIAINVGGALLPSLFALYLFLTRAPFLPTVICTIIITAVSKKLARPVPGVGIAMPAFIPPLIAAAVALLFAPNAAPPVAFISGVWGTLIGADLLNIKKFPQLGAHMVSIGGAGIYDGIVLVGIVAALLT